MTNQKHFKAVHRETKEEIEFGLEDIEADDFCMFIHVAFNKHIKFDCDEAFLKDYELFYWHGGWHAYD
jgi:hypothetical protein